MTPEADIFGDRKYLNTDEMPRFYEAARSLPKLRDTALCLTTFFTGGRASEVLLIRPEHLYPEYSVIKMRTLKQRDGKIKYRYVRVPPELMKMLVELSNGDERIINLGRTRAYKIMKDCMELAGITGKKACSRGLRHSYTTTSLRADVPLSQIQKEVGHARLETTLGYMDFVDDDAREFAQQFWDLATGKKKPEDMG